MDLDGNPFDSMRSALDVCISTDLDHQRKKGTVRVQGSADNVKAAIASLKHLFMYYHDEYVMPGVDHVEFALPDGFGWDRLPLCLSDQELRHIRKNWRVFLVLPFEHSLNANIVILGDNA